MTTVSLPRFEYWSTRTVFGTHWYWHLKAENGKVVADGSEGYATEANVLRAINNFYAIVSAAATKPAVEITRTYA